MRLAPLFVLALAAPAMAAGAPDLVRKAADLRGADVAGVVAYEVNADMTMDGMMGKKVTHWRGWTIAKDGDEVESKLLSLTVDGAPASESERAKMAERMAHPKHKRGMLDLPIEREHLAAYAYAPAPCAGCEAGAVSFGFTATPKDKRHSDGSMVVGKHGRLLRLTCSPTGMSDRISDATFTVEYGPIGKDWWGVTRVNSKFSGGIGPLKGSMTMAQKHAGHKRFRDLDDARAAAPK